MVTSDVKEGKRRGFSFFKMPFGKKEKSEIVEADMEYMSATMKENEALKDENEDLGEKLQGDNEEATQKSKTDSTSKAEREQSFLFEKQVTCPVCGEDFKEKFVKSKKVRLIKTERDLRPVHKGIDTGKYDVIVCPHCGYASLSRFFKMITLAEAALIKNTIAPEYAQPAGSKETYDYADALSRYKLALSNAIVKQAKFSEKAYICLKTAWIVRGMQEEIGNETAENKAFLKSCKDLEQQYLKQAYKGFMVAMENESFPICGMDEITFHYLVGALAYNNGKYDVTEKMLKYLSKNQQISPKLQEKIERLQELVISK